MKKLKDIGELKLIEEFAKYYKAGKDTVVGIGDDAAVIKMPDRNKYLLFTCDTIVEGVHFPKKRISGYKIGWKAVGAGISDIGAMGGIPKSAAISLALPPNLKVSFVADFMKGVKNLASKFHVDIVGGDTVSSPNGIVISVSVIGIVEKKNLVLRSGAKIGDKILVTGTLGGSIFKKQFSFMPRIKEARWLVSHGRINAMMDITDGLSLDLYKLITASKTGALLYGWAVPLSKDAFRTKDPLKSALNDGEDFELLVVTPDADKLIEQWPNKETPLKLIGEITKETGVVRLMGERYAAGRKIRPKGYEHFK